MSIFAQVYTDEDVAGLVATLLKSRGISATGTTTAIPDQPSCPLPPEKDTLPITRSPANLCGFATDLQILPLEERIAKEQALQDKKHALQAQQRLEAYCDRRALTPIIYRSSYRLLPMRMKGAQ
jgi:hypothetical protein